MFNDKILKVVIATIVFGATLSQAASAQIANTLRNPLIPGAPSAPPGVEPPPGQPPAIGDGPTPAPVVPGDPGQPLLPFVPITPNGIFGGGDVIPLPLPGIESPPGVLGPALTGVVPPPLSTPGADPGSMQAPPGFINPADPTHVLPGGGLPGTGGYYTTINKVRRGGQESRDQGIGLNSAWGGGGDGSQDGITQFGPLAGSGLPFGVPNSNGYNKGPAGSNDDLRHSSIDMGGGMRIGNISLGSTLQDFGLSATRSGAGPLGANQSTEFGQGLRRTGVYSSKSTDFGFPYTQFDPANITPQKTGQHLLPTAILTNF